MGENSQKVQISCEFGHVYDISEQLVKDYRTDEDILGTISFCRVDVAKPEYANAIVPCGGRVVWSWRKVQKALDKLK